MYSDNGTNFVGASGILKDEFRNIWSDKEQSKIYNPLRQKGITWHFSPPLASHAGGVMGADYPIHQKDFLTALTTEQTLEDETLSTLLAEAERILNDRPLVCGEGQVDDLDPLTPSKLLLLRSNLCLPLGVLVGVDSFGRQWRQAQVLANSVWKPWISEYLPTLQLRQKWRKGAGNVEVTDLVLLVDSGCPRASSYCSNQQWKEEMETNGDR